MLVHAISWVIAIAFAAFSSITMAIYHGWAASILWEWFIVPLGAPGYTTMQMAGVQLVISFLFISVRENRLAKHKCKEPRRIEIDYWRSQLNMLLSPPLSLSIGWLVKLFM